MHVSRARQGNSQSESGCVSPLVKNYEGIPRAKKRSRLPPRHSSRTYRVCHCCQSQHVHKYNRLWLHSFPDLLNRIVASYSVSASFTLIRSVAAAPSHLTPYYAVLAASLYFIVGSTSNYYRVTMACIHGGQIIHLPDLTGMDYLPPIPNKAGD